MIPALSHALIRSATKVSSRPVMVAIRSGVACPSRLRISRISRTCSTLTRAGRARRGVSGVWRSVVGVSGPAGPNDGLFDLDPCNDPAGPAAPLAHDDDPGPRAGSPLAVRMRPRNLGEVVGQAHLLAPGAPLRRLVEGAAPASVLLYGPPGTGKTTIARLMAGAGAPGTRHFVAVSALSAGW